MIQPSRTLPQVIPLGLAAALLAGSCSGVVSGPDVAPPAAPASLHRLTVRQYLNSVHDLVGQDVTVTTELEEDTKLHGYTSVATGEMTISPRAAEEYEAAAREIAHQVVTDPARRAAVIGCDSPTSECLRAFFTRFGRRAWRRPLDRSEVDQLMHVTDAAAGAIGDPWAGVEFGLAAVLESPHFLYRVEIGKHDPDSPARLRLGGYEIATRLSYLFWDTTPDDDLLDAAERGDLDTAAGVKAAAARLLASPRARVAIVAFYAEYLNLDRMSSMSKNADMFPQFTPELVEGMRGEIERLFGYIVFDKDSDYRDILTTKITFVNPALAALYGVAGPDDTDAPGPDDFVQRDLGPSSARGGLLTTAGLLALYAHDTVTSPTRRGKFVRQNLLCEDIPPPPPGVVTSLDGAEGDTLREKLENHRKNPVCAGCHNKMDPIGLGLEDFDPIGQVRTEELPGVPVDSSGDLDGVPFNGAGELSQMLRHDPRVAPCFARQLYRFATGHLELEREMPLIDHMADDFARDGYRVQDLLLDVVASDGFRYAALPDTDPTQGGDL